ncbi:MAG: glycosyltransferase [Candidatus Binatia bacterium]
MRVLLIAYPFEPVSPASAGGSEQILGLVDRELTRQGHACTVLAREGSRVSGRQVCSARANASYAESCRSFAASLSALLACERFDVAHDHGAEVQHGWSAEVALLATLHRARSLYRRDPLVSSGRCFYNLVSEHQRGQYAAPWRDHLPVVRNGIALEHFRVGAGRREFAVVVGRVCPEKGFHHAIAAAREAGIPLVVIGKVYEFDSHKQYFATAIAPHLGTAVQWVGSPTPTAKRELLAVARCVLIPSEVEETSSLVAMEAAASGAPVICFRRGALPEVVEDGRTGFVVDGEQGMACAIARCGELSPDECRRRAETRFSARRMAREYLALYAQIAA